LVSSNVVPPVWLTTKALPWPSAVSTTATPSCVWEKICCALFTSPSQLPPLADASKPAGLA
jgi:hypothetical protein